MVEGGGGFGRGWTGTGVVIPNCLDASLIAQIRMLTSASENLNFRELSLILYDIHPLNKNLLQSKLSQQ